MSKNIPNKNDMKALVKSIYNTAYKLNNNIQINSTDDAANLAAYLYGFSSWAEYQQTLEKEYETVVENFVVKIPKFRDKIIKESDLPILDKYISNTKSQLDINLELKESNMIPLECLIGQKRNHQAKVSEPVGLLTENFIITSSPNNTINQLYQEKIVWLIKNKQSFFIFGNESEGIISIGKENNIDIFGKGYHCLNPLQEALENDNLENLLNIQVFEEKQTFPWLWITLIKLLKDEYQWSPKLLLKFLDLEFLLQIRKKLENINDILAKMLDQYLFKKCQIKIDNNTEYLISEKSQGVHYHNIFLLKERLEKLSLLYEKGYFSLASKIRLKNYIYNKKSSIFIECKEEIQKDYWDFCNITFLQAIKTQNKQLENLNNKNYRVWSIWWDASRTISEISANEILNNKDTLILGAYLLSSKHFLQNWFSEFRQIIFCKQFIDDYPQLWKEKALSETIYWEENLWFENYGILKKLPENFVYIWKPQSILTMKGTEVFEFKKIEIYNKFP